jgi:hypothetical protein
MNKLPSTPISISFGLQRPAREDEFSPSDKPATVTA